MGFLLVVFIIIAVLAFKTIKVVRQSEVYIIERLGKFHKVADAGLTVIVPFIDTVRSVVSLKQQTMDIPPQGVITSDNVTITIDTVVFYKITDPAKAVYEIQSLKKGIEYLSVTTIRDIVGKMELDQTFSSRDIINDKLRVILDEATDAWGCKIDRVEIKDITPPADIRDAMEKQMNAERNKRALILEAEAERQSAITLAEGRIVVVKLIEIREADDEGYREVVFEVNGNRRSIRILDKAANKVKATTSKIIADVENHGEIGANIPGTLIKLLVKEGDYVEANQPIAVLEAMKMETNVLSTISGTVKKIYIKEGTQVIAGELIAEIRCDTCEE